MRKRESKLSSAYYDIKGVGSFGGIQALAKKTKGNQKQIKDWLESQDAYTLHKPVRYRFPRRKTIVSGPSQQWQADLIDVSRLSQHNQGIKFLLTCIDVFSKKAWVVPLKNKSGISLVAAFKSIQHPLPKTLQTDKGTEFLNYTFQQWLKDHKSISSQQKMKISKQASLNVSIGLWKQSCGAILPIMTPWPTQTYWSLWWMFIITLHIAVLVWHLMMSHLQIKGGYGSDFMPTQCLIKSLPCTLGTQFASVRQDVHSRRVIWLSGLKKFSPLWKGRVHNLPLLCWQITVAKC